MPSVGVAAEMKAAVFGLHMPQILRLLGRAYLAAALLGFAPGLNAQRILSGRCGAPIYARARHIVIYVAYSALGMSLTRVAIAFGRDRSAVARARRMVEGYREDPNFDTWVDQLAVGLRSVALLVPGEVAS